MLQYDIRVKSPPHSCGLTATLDMFKIKKIRRRKSKAKRMATLRPHPILFVYCLAFHMLHSLQVQAQPTYLNKICTNTSSYTEGSQFQKNLNHLLQDHTTGAESNTTFFSTTTRGNFPDKVYAIFLCKGDFRASTCQNCIDAASKAVVNECPFRKEAIIWYDDCLIRYSDNTDFLTELAVDPRVNMSSTSNVTERLDNIDKIIQNMFADLSSEAAFNSFNRSYADTEVDITDFIKLYGVVQCTPYLMPNDCSFCFSSLDLHFIQSRGGVFTPSCYFRYELYSANTAHYGSGAKRRKTIIIVISASVSAFFVFALLGILICFRRRKRTRREKQENCQNVQLLELEGERLADEYSGDSFPLEKQEKSQDFPLLQLDLIRTATQHFSEENKRGEGGFGPVYKGTLADGKEIAVKRLSRTSGQGLKEFKAEVTLIARLQHRNLVKLLGCCLEGKELLLVYDYMPNKSLDVFLVDPTKGAQLDWKIRHRIINGIARGMLYLHEDSRLRIIHRDLKSSNVLLDHEMNPKISDFGLARIVGSNQIEANTNRVVGTYGYMAPEYAMKGIFSVKSDVFSFGVLLLEIISGKKNSRFHLSGHGHNLLTFAWKLWSDGRGLELIDLLLKESYVETEVLKCIHIGLLCVQEDPANRPTMSSVVFMMGSDAMALPQPTEPAFFLGRVVPSAQPEPKDIGSSVDEVTLSNVSPR